MAMIAIEMDAPSACDNNLSSKYSLQIGVEMVSLLSNSLVWLLNLGMSSTSIVLLLKSVLSLNSFLIVWFFFYSFISSQRHCIGPW